MIGFVKFIYRTGFKAHLFLLLTVVMAISSLAYFPVNRLLQAQFRIERPLPYFHALVSGHRAMSEVKRQLSSLPGVNSIKARKTAHLQEQARVLLSDLGLEELHQSQAYQGIQVFLNPALRARSYELIKEYLVRLLGKSKITFSALKYPAVATLKKRESSIRFLYQWGYPLLLTVFGLLWLLSFLAISADFQRYCYVIEQYQRRKRVAFKIITSGLLMVMILALLGVLGVEKINGYFFMGTLIFMLAISSSLCFGKRWV